jgi:hypothetical protein
MVINYLFIPVMNNWNWYMGGFFEILCMVVNSLFIPMKSVWNWYMGDFSGIFCKVVHGLFQNKFRYNYLLHFQV